MSQNDQEESKHASVAPSESSNFLQGWLSDQFSRKEDKDMSDAPAEQAPRVDDSLGDSTNIHVALKDDGLGHNPPRVIVRKQEEDEVSALNSGRREAGHGRSIISYAASLSSADETNSCSDQENSQRPSKKKRGVRGMRLSAYKERSSAYSVNSFDVNKLSDEENDGLHNCTDQDVHKLKETLHGLNFEDIDKILPWTPEMELDDKAVGDNKADEMKSEEPLNDAEIACLRQKMRTSRMFGQENNEETTPLTFDDEGRPMAVSDFDRGPRGKALRKIKENLDRPATKLSEDSFSFLISARPLSVPFILGGLVLLVKGTLFTLICINLTDMNDEDNPLGIPAGVSPTVAVAQFLAMFIAVLTQDDIRTALNYFQEGYEAKQMGAAFIGAGYWQWLISVWLQFLEGSLGLGATFLLIVTSDEVVALILDFTAVEFITLLDNAAFLLAGQGFMGPKNKLEFEIVMNTEYVIPKSRKRTPKRQICTLFATFSVLLIGWSVIYARQMQGYYTPQSITIQFDDDLRPELGAYSGLYDLTIQPNKIDISRVAYKAVNGEGFIGYCYPRKYWTFSTGNTDPCSNIVVKSSPSHSFDITDATDDEWFATEDSDLQRYYPMENFLLELTCDRDVDCGGIGHGSCEDHQCACSEGYYGIRCDYHVDDACESIAVDERRDLFRASRNYASSFDLLRDANGQIVQVYHHPVFVSDSETDGGLDVIMYIGARWALSHSIEGLPQLGDHSYEGLAEYLSTAAFHAAEHLKSLAFFTEPVIFNSPDDGDSPVGIRWFNVLEADLSNTARLGSINTLMLCAVCNTEENPCQNGNQCGEEGACKCANGASGSLCQITPLGNGHCDIFFNSASYKYDGGDCCKATCISSQDHTCGAISTTTQSAVDQGFPYCVDPTVVAPCGSESCWAPTSRHVDLRHSVTTLTTLSANGRILAVVAPSLDIVTVYDQQDSRWIQRGPILEGKRGSQFGKTLALSTLPGAIVNRRYGKVPILMAIGIHGLSKAGVRITRWEPNDLDWRPVGDVIDICSSSPVNCDLLAVDIGRDGDRVMLAVVRKDNVVQVYRTTLTETGSQPWVLDYLADGNEEQESKGFYKCASLSGMTNLVALARGNLVELYYPEDNADPGSSLFDVPSYVLDIRVQVNLIQNYFGYDNFTSPVESIHSVKLSADEKSLLVFCEGEGEYDYLIRYVVTPSQPPIANNFRNFTTSILSEKAIKSGLSIVRFSSDASSIAVRVNTTDGPRVRLVSYNATSQEFDPVGALFTDIQEEMRLNEALGNDFIDELQDFGLSYDGGSYIQGGTNGPEGYGIVPRCTTASDHYRIAITLDENPSSVSWTLDTYQILGNRTFPNRVVRECDSCYFDDDRFGRGIVADDVCVQTNFGACLRLQFQSETGLQPGSGMVLFKDGQEEARFEERDTDPFYHLPNPEAVSDCTVPILNCAEDQVHIVVEMNLDDFSSLDTSWMLLDDNSTILAEGGGYTNEEDRSTILSQVCGDKNSTFEFTILDGPPEDAFFDPENFDTNKYRIDGLCCDWGKGGYNIYVDGEKTHSLQGERDFRMEELLFDSDGSVLARTVPITFEIQLDAFPDEITWWFETPDQTEIWWFRDYLRTQVAPNSYITDTVYLVEGASYYLVLRDAFADGFCCGEYGDGYYNVYWGTEVDPSKKMLSATGDFAPDNFVDHLIVVSEDSILEPTQPAVATPDPTIEPTESTDSEGDEGPSGGNHTTGGEGSGTNSTTEGDNERS